MLLAQNARGDDLEAIARATTVFIAPDLEKDSFARGDISEYSGSGVIIAKALVQAQAEAVSARGLVSGDIQQYHYYVLTNAHVVADETIYGVRLYDGEVYRVDDSTEYKEQFGTDPIAHTIHRFGKVTDGQGTYEGMDLAIVKFVSDKSYPVATASPVENAATSSQVLISGWPLPARAERVTRSRFSRYGQLVSSNAGTPTNGGYSLEFNVSGMSNMSGGPVFNSSNKLIAIYGKGDDETGYGIPVEQFIRHLQPQEAYRKAFVPIAPDVKFSNTVDPLAVTQGRIEPLKADNIPEQEFNSKFGVLDVLSRDPEYRAIRSLEQKYKCMKGYPDGTFRPKVFQVRGELASDITLCLDRISKSLVATLGNNHVTHSELQEFQQRLERIAEDIADLQKATAQKSAAHKI